MLIYEVTAIVESSIAAEYETYMRETHIPDLLATGHFAAAFFAKNGDTYRIGYHCDSRGQLDSYFANHAEKLRNDLAKHFPSGIKLSRQVLEIIELFPSS